MARKRGSKNKIQTGTWLRCENCGEAFYVQKRRLESGNSKFCSMRCVYDGRKHPDRMGVIKQCGQCGNDFYVPLYRIETAHFCSRKCGTIANRKALRRVWREKAIPKLIAANKGRADHPETRRYKRAFYDQRDAAKRRGIEWGFTFEQWLKVWQDSGLLHERGRLSGQYVMARNGDVGSYCIDNVRIVLVSINLDERDVSKLRGRNNRGSKLTEVQVCDIRAVEGTELRKTTAARYGLNYYTVRDIQKRKAWHWLD